MLGVADAAHNGGKAPPAAPTGRSAQYSCGNSNAAQIVMRSLFLETPFPGRVEET